MVDDLVTKEDWIRLTPIGRIIEMSTKLSQICDSIALRNPSDGLGIDSL